MPSPIGHSLIGLALGSAFLLKPARGRELVRDAWRKRWPLVGAIALANAPDVDYLPGMLTGDINAYHHGYTHTLGWCLLVAGAVALLRRARVRDVRLSAFLYPFALVASHLAADWVTDDGKAPYGIMAWWPFSDTFVIAPVTVFVRLHKRAWSEFIQWHNVEAVLWEAAVCLPLVLLVVAWKAWRTKRNPGGLPAGVSN